MSRRPPWPIDYIFLALLTLGICTVVWTAIEACNEERHWGRRAAIVVWMLICLACLGAGWVLAFARILNS